MLENCSEKVCGIPGLSIKDGIANLILLEFKRLISDLIETSKIPSDLEKMQVEKIVPRA